MKENQKGRFHAPRMETACILPSLRKSFVNMARFTVFGSQKFASFSASLRGMKLKLSELTVEKVNIPIIKPISSLKQSIFWNVGRISDFVDWNVQRDAGTLVQERSFFSKTAFSHKVWPIHLKSMNIFDAQGY